MFVECRGDRGVILVMMFGDKINMSGVKGIESFIFMRLDRLTQNLPSFLEIITRRRMQHFFTEKLDPNLPMTWCVNNHDATVAIL